MASISEVMSVSEWKWIITKISDSQLENVLRSSTPRLLLFICFGLGRSFEQREKNKEKMEEGKKNITDEEYQ